MIFSHVEVLSFFHFGREDSNKLEKTQHFYWPSSCPSKKTFVLAHFTNENTFLFKQHTNKTVKLIFFKMSQKVLI